VMKFDEWFTERFGPEPEPGRGFDDIRQEIYRAEEHVTLCRNRLGAKREWWVRRNGALKAWVAREDTAAEHS